MEQTGYNNFQEANTMFGNVNNISHEHEGQTVALTGPLPVPTPRCIAKKIAARIELIDAYYRKKWAERVKKAIVQEQLPIEKHFCFVDTEQSSSDIYFFIETLIIGGDFTSETLLVAFILLERFIECSPIRRPMDFCNLYAVSVLVAHKYLEETERWILEEYALLTDISKVKIASMERWFLRVIRNRVFVYPK